MSNPSSSARLTPESIGPVVLHCLESYLRTTENWIFRLIKHQTHTRRYIASARFLRCDFSAPGLVFLRSPVQPDLDPEERPVGLRRWMRTVSVLTYMWYLRVVLRGRPVNILHSHFAHVGWRYQRLAGYLRARHVISFYGWDYVRLAAIDPAWLKRLRHLYATADCFLCEGPHGAEMLERNGCPRNKIRIARLGVEPAAIPFFRRTKPIGQLRLVQVASFREKKGHAHTVAAFADALERWPDMHLTLIGAVPGEIEDSISGVIHARGIEDKVSLLPGVGFDQLHAAMGEYHVFIHPSRHARDGDCEGGAPVVLLDAQATGMPVISTTHCDIPQEVIDGSTGILCAEGDVPGLAVAIGTFYEMGQVAYDTFSRAAREHVERNFDARDCAKNVEAIYRDLASSPARVLN